MIRFNYLKKEEKGSKHNPSDLLINFMEVRMRFYPGFIFAAILLVSGCVAATSPNFNMDDLKSKASAGDTTAMLKLGAVYDFGHGTPVDKKEAARWYLSAAEAGNPNAQNSIGSMYQAGEGVEKDLSKALYWYQKAEQQGHPEGTNNLAFLYDTAPGMVDKKKAIQLYTLAAERGFIPAFVNLGMAYARGDGVPVNKVEAFKWLDLGRFYTQNADNNMKAKWLVRSYLDDLKTKMTPEEISQGEALSAAWGKEHAR